MRMHTIIALCLLSVGLFALAGCNGPSPGLDPQVTWVFGEDSTFPFVDSGERVTLNATATVEDEGENRIISYEWSQAPPVGTFVATDQLATIWIAPELNPGDDPVDVTLSLRVTTLLGGETVKTLNLTVVPPD